MEKITKQIPTLRQIAGDVKLEIVEVNGILVIMGSVNEKDREAGIKFLQNSINSTNSTEEMLSVVNSLINLSENGINITDKNIEQVTIDNDNSILIDYQNCKAMDLNGKEIAKLDYIPQDKKGIKILLTQIVKAKLEK